MPKKNNTRNEIILSIHFVLVTLHGQLSKTNRTGDTKYNIKCSPPAKDKSLDFKFNQYYPSLFHGLVP